MKMQAVDMYRCKTCQECFLFSASSSNTETDTNADGYSTVNKLKPVARNRSEAEPASNNLRITEEKRKDDPPNAASGDKKKETKPPAKPGTETPGVPPPRKNSRTESTEPLDVGSVSPQTGPVKQKRDNRPADSHKPALYERRNLAKSATQKGQCDTGSQVLYENMEDCVSKPINVEDLRAHVQQAKNSGGFGAEFEVSV